MITTISYGTSMLDKILDMHGNIDEFIRVTRGAVHDVNLLDEIMPEAGASTSMDKRHNRFLTVMWEHGQ